MINKREYNKALKTVNAYQQQINPVITKPFRFLWYNRNEKAYNRNITANCIDNACRKFILNIPKTMISLDYEVYHGSECFDISNRNEFRNYI